MEAACPPSLHRQVMFSLTVTCCCCRILSPTPFPLPSCSHLNPVIGLGFYVLWSLKYLTLEWRSAFVLCNCEQIPEERAVLALSQGYSLPWWERTVVRATLLAAGVRDVTWQQTGSRDASKACPCDSGAAT